MHALGKQEEGSSDRVTKRMALEAFAHVGEPPPASRLADIGCGRGELSLLLSGYGQEIVMLDSYRPPALPPRASFVQGDLNGSWPIDSGTIAFAFGVEVIEHVENPRHFMREFARILKPGGFGYLSTPNNHSLMSKLTFLLKGEHRLFQDLCYPAHITPLMECDFLRIFSECQLRFVRAFYSNEDTMPRLHWRLKGPGRYFSATWGLLFEKPALGER